MKYDPVENTPEYKAIEQELEKKIEARVGKFSGLGYCHLYWAAKRKILEEEYGIKWRSPAELNPTVRYD